jgi:serine protease inhibitor
MRAPRWLTAAPAARNSMTASMLAALLVAVLLAAPAEAETDRNGEPHAFADRINQLGSETLSRLAGKKGDSTVVVSPYGLGSALHLLGLGAGGEAERSLHGRLLPPGVEAGGQDAGLTALKEQLLRAGGDKLKLTLSNTVFVPKGAVSSPRFVRRARAVLDAPVEALDFKGAAAALARINAWTREATHGLVPRVLDELDPDARFVLTNAVYFRGAWETAFEQQRTEKAPFTRVDGSTRDATMMDATMPAGFAETASLQAVWLPYAGREVAMLVIAPGHGQGPATVAEALQARSLDSLMSEMLAQRRTASIRVRLPRFRAETALDVTDALAGLGLGPAFATPSNYAAINKAKGGPLMVMHRAVLEVGEQGTTAAAVTAVAPERSLSLTPLFSADRPFALAIVHEPTRAILFAGYIADPREEPTSEPGQSTRRN